MFFFMLWGLPKTFFIFLSLLIPAVAVLFAGYDPAVNGVR
jgi:hypothetical protein